MGLGGGEGFGAGVCCRMYMRSSGVSTSGLFFGLFDPVVGETVFLHQEEEETMEWGAGADDGCEELVHSG